MAASVANCATPYKPNGLMGGYSEVQLNADTFQISVQGNAYTSTDRAQKIALLRAAELTLAAGAEHFVMLGGGVSRNYAGSAPVVVNQAGNTLIASGGDAIVKPSGSYTIRIVHPNDPAFGSALDARLIQKQLLPQLGG
jgi:uncharacterized protein (UPF0261 family)